MPTSSNFTDIWTQVRSERQLEVLAPGPIVVPDPPGVESRRLDGTLWRRHWTDGDRLVVDFMEAGCAEVIGNQVRFNRTLDEQSLEHIVLDHILPLWLAWTNHLVVHAALAAKAGKGFALIGPSGSGKSTLVSHLAYCGWQVGGDDGIVISADKPPLADATYPSIRLTDQSVALLGAADTTPIAGKSRLRLGTFDLLDAPIELGALVFVEPNDTSVSRLIELGRGRAHALLFGATFHADLDAGGSLPAVFDHLGAVVEQTIPVRLCVGRGRDGLESARRLLEQLVAQD